MPVLDLSFEWPVDDAGYQIVTPEKPKKPKKPKKPQRSLRGPFSTPGPTAADVDLGPRIKRRGGSLRMIRPLDHNTLFVDFAHLDGSDDSCIEFASRFGYLGLFPAENSEDGAGETGESIRMWRDVIDDMRRNVEGWQANPAAFVPDREIVMARLDASLVPLDGRAVLRIRPQSLIGAMQLQFAQAISTGLDIRNCDHCGKLFETGGGGRTRKARFCTDRCRSDFHVAKRKVPSGNITKKRRVSK